MASSVIKKPNNRVIKYFDVVVPGGSNSYNFASDAPSDYNVSKRLCAMSMGGAGAHISQLGSTMLYFDPVLSSDSTIRIAYYVD